MLVFKPSDRIPVAVGGMKFLIAPMTVEQKARLTEFRKMVGGKDVADNGARIFHAIKFALKGIEGGDLKRPGGAPFELEFEADGTLTDECVEAIFNLSQAGLLAAYCYSMTSGIREEHGIEGVEVDFKGVIIAPKKESTQGP